MGRLIAAEQRKARKEHRDDSATFIVESLDWLRHGRLTFTELRAIAQLKANNWRILRGQLYVKQFNTQEGHVYTFKTLPSILNICLKYKLYGDD